MSEEITQELMERLKSRDERVAVLDEALAINAEIENSPTLRALLRATQIEADQALEDLASVTPTDHNAIIKLQAIVYRARFIRDTILGKLKAGERAEISLREEAEIEIQDAENGES